MFLQKYEKDLFKDIYINDLTVDLIVRLFTEWSGFNCLDKRQAQGKRLKLRDKSRTQCETKYPPL